MPPDQGLWISESDVVASVSLAPAIAAVHRAYLRAAAGEVTAMPKTFASWDGGTLHATGAVAGSSGLAIAKTWAHTAGGAAPLLVAWDSASGRLIAVIEAFALGQLRTAAVTGAATSALAAPHCEVLAVVGSGRQAEGQVAAVAAVRDIQKIKVYSPTEEHRVKFADRIAQRSGIATLAVGSAEEALDQAGVVVTVTRAREPFVRPSMVAGGAHINAVGAITPDRAELDPAVVAGARRVVADDVAAARALAAREISIASAPHVLSLASTLAAGDRPGDTELTIFKALGSGISDLAVAELVLERARVAGLGRPIARPSHCDPRMWSA